ncbi:hypothetical protein P9112_002400 [Eukaryota sp. TZLM1-RC]
MSDLYEELFGAGPSEEEKEVTSAVPEAETVTSVPDSDIISTNTALVSSPPEVQDGEESPLEYFEPSEDEDFMILLKQDLVAKHIQQIEEKPPAHTREQHDSSHLVPITSIPVRVISNKGGDEVAWTKGKEIIANALAAPVPDEYKPPMMPGMDRSIYDFDIDQDPEKAWRRPGADMSDYFNYGFTEDTFRLYCQRQADFRVAARFRKPQQVTPTRTRYERPAAYPPPSAYDEELPPGVSSSGGFRRR